MIRDLSYILVSAVIVFSAILGYNYVTEQQQNNLRYTSGTYTVSAEGYHGPVELAVTFDSVSIKNIEIVKEEETAEIGHVAIPVVIDRIMKAQGGGINAVTGATVTSMAVVNAVCNAASEAGVSNLAAFKTKKAKKIKEHKVEDTWDIVIVGGGGAGLAAAAQAAQDGNTVLVIEKNADLGGNTVISGGSYQCVTPYLVWNKEDPDATEAMGYDGKMHRKVNATNGNIATLKILLDWNEEPFDEEYYKTHEFEAGNEIELSKHGVHSEYLPVLKALKDEIRAYLAYADKEMKKGKKENQLTLFSTTNLHIFQTYYGGLRQSFDKTEYIYGQVDLVSQFITEGIDLQPWFMNMGVEYNDVQSIIVGGLWQRAINMRGANITLNGKEEYYQGKLGAYVMAPYAATLNANAHNRIMTQTSAEDLIVKDGRVVGVHASGEDGTKLTAYARKGVIVATGGYAANIKKVVETNKYWSKDDLLPSTKTTNRSSLQGDGIWMAEAVGAGVTGMGWTQLLPLSYAETGNIAFGGVEAAAIISPVTGERYIDELSERDVLSWAAFKNGVELFGTRGSFLYFCPAMVGDGYMPVLPDVPNNQYTLKLSEIPAVTKALGLNTDTDKLIETIRDFDQSVINNTPFKNVSHKYRTLPIGHIEMNADRSFNKKTYDIDNYPVMMRILAPATHHTMGGLTIDMQRHVLDTEGNIIPGLYAAGEVTGGIHGGNRLGGNAITEVLVSGRIAAKAANQE